MNPRIADIKLAQATIVKITAQYDVLRAEALQDGIIDAAEQTDLDNLSTKLDQLRDVVSEQSAILQRNRDIWDALAAARSEFEDRMATLKGANWPDIAKMEQAYAVMVTAETDQRWADATKVLEAVRAKMAASYQSYLATQPAAPAGDPSTAAPGVNADQDKYDAAKAGYARAITALERHAQSGDPTIASLIVTIKAKATSAEASASSADYAAAFALISPLAAECAAVEDKAHDLAHFNAVLGQRTTLVNNPDPAVLTTDPAIDDLKTAIDTLFTSAQADATAAKYSDGVAKLDQIPALHERRRALNERRTRYLNRHGDVTWYIGQINPAPATDRAALQATINRFTAEFTAADYTNTNDYAGSAAKMQHLTSEFATIFNILTAAADYTTALTAFDAQLAILDPHAGRVAIEEFFQARKADRAQAVTEAAATKYPTAVQLLQRTQAGAWVAQKVIADAYVVYDGNRATARTLITTIAALPDTADAIAQAETLMTLAATQAVAKNITGAEASLVEATARANEAKAASDAQTALDAQHDTGALDGAASDFPAALAVYVTMRATVAGLDTTNTFAADLTAADVPVDAAKIEATKTAPDATILRAKLDEGIAALQVLQPKILAQAGFATHYATARALVDTTLPPLNVDNCIQPAIDACKTLLTEADTLAKAPSFDFVTAEAKLQEATARGRQAEINAGLYAANIQPDIANINGAIALINTSNANVQTLLVARMTRLTGLLTDIATDITNEDFSAADSKGNEGTEVAAATTQDRLHAMKIDANYPVWVTARIGQIQGGQPAVANALAETNGLIADHQACLASGAYGAAWSITNQLYWSIQGGIDALTLAGPYNTAQSNARAALDALTAKRSPGIQEKLTAFETRYTAAVALGAEPQYAIATQHMNALTTEANAVLPLADAHTAYGPAQAHAQQQLTAAETHPQRAAIETVLGMLRDKYNAAEAIAAADDPARAKTMMENVSAGADEALAEADFAQTRADITGALGENASDADGPTAQQIEATQTALTALTGRNNSDIATQEFTDAETALTTAKDSSASPADRTNALRQALDLIAAAGNLISQNQLLEAALEDARQSIATHRSHPQSAYLDTVLNDATTEIGVISSRAVNLAALPGCSNDLTVLVARMRDVGPKLDAHGEYVILRAKPEVEPRLVTLEEHDHAYAIQTNIDAIRRKLAEATRLSEALDPIPAVALLKEVETLGASALMLANMRANVPPTPAEVTAILNGPGGEAELDAMIDALEPDAQRAVLSVAFEARFGCTLQNFQGIDAAGNPANPIAAGTQDGPDIRRFYEIMSDLPDVATIENDSMRVFTVIESGGGSYYNGSDKDVVMREGDAALSSAYGFGVEGQVGQLAPDFQPANDDPVSFFSWNTLHEVGHAVDDQHGFMRRNQSSPDYGGWTEYGANVDPIATVLAGHFNYDKRYIQQAMNRKLPTGTTPGEVAPGVPQPQGGASPEDWEGRRVAFSAWLAQVRTSRNPWSSNSGAQRIAIGGIVYQESYDGSWTSYQLAARSKGMTGYQFRAPGEWFSELYAAYHSGKLKPTHPAAAWLEALDGPE
ncbi:hypothetical protein [Tateyamaria sp.]|uniref:hypothetical protein n=1 Tax=Tateyamaria sp. TaxID=1929288 RepID=UPI00328D77B7